MFKKFLRWWNTLECKLCRKEDHKDNLVHVRYNYLLGGYPAGGDCWVHPKCLAQQEKKDLEEIVQWQGLPILVGH